nr:MAG TPA: hypothetical protein [Caudoviricetes sp.]
MLPVRVALFFCPKVAILSLNASLSVLNSLLILRCTSIEIYFPW